MTSTSPENSTDPLAATIDSIDRLLDELAALSEQAWEPARFYQELLDRAVLAVAAEATAVWVPGPQGELMLAAHSQVDRVYPNLNHARYREDRRHLQALLARAGSSPSSPAASTPSLAAQAGEGRPGLIAAPIMMSSESLGMLTLYVGEHVGEAEARLQQQFAIALAEIAADFEKNHRVRRHADQLRQWERLNRCTLAAYRSLKPQQIAFELVNEGRAFLECDRVSLLLRPHWRLKLIASSGLTTIDPRAELVRRMREFAGQVEASGETLHYRPGLPSVAARPRKFLDRYLAVSAAHEVLCVPLYAPPTGPGSSDSAARRRCVGLLCIETLAEESPPLPLDRCQLLAQHASTALARATQYQRIPLRPVWEMLAQVWGLFGWRTLPKTLIVLAVVLAAVLPLFLVETDFVIEARGELRPVRERHVFAPADGIVDQLDVAHGSPVQAGDVIAKLRSPELDRELEAVRGEQQSAQQKIDSLTLAISQANPNTTDAALLQTQWAGQIAELEQKLTNLRQQERLLVDERAELKVTSPITGEVLTWQIEQLLLTRPVRRGESMLRIADVAGPWHLELKVPDRKIGYVLSASATTSDPLPIRFVLETDPDSQVSAQLDDISEMAVSPTAETPYVPVTASFAREQVDQLRPGATVVAKIDCGRRKLGYVWLHDLIDSFHRRFFW